MFFFFTTQNFLEISTKKMSRRQQKQNQQQPEQEQDQYDPARAQDQLKPTPGAPADSTFIARQDVSSHDRGVIQQQNQQQKCIKGPVQDCDRQFIGAGNQLHRDCDAYNSKMEQRD